ncbi:MAG: preprotein translocase subunit SecA, partial [Candidatus Omnitrophica bacterium]|nr:preprotein translocase subunit SecA [Candidatus Omnitrophota bacterium]
MLNILKKIIVPHRERQLWRLKPVIARINSFAESLAALSDDRLRAKTDEFKKHIAEKRKELDPVLDGYKEKLSQMTSPEEKDKLRAKIRNIKNKIFEDILPEAFAVVREVAARTVTMRHFDVQMIGGIVLHEGKIAEMATGEGKTLVATLPAYLNALTGEGVHVVTVNDYLAKRDREWMGPIYEFLGLTVGVIQHDMDVAARQQQYACDITYGTNNEFGFDYLRDNLVISKDDRSQRKFNYAIVDEVDSILIDEARTPLIISGPVDTVNTAFVENRGVVDHITKMQHYLVQDYLQKLKQVLAGPAGGQNEDEAKKLLYILHKGSPKEREFLDIILNDTRVKSLMDKAAASYDSKMMEGERMELLEGLYFSFEERTREVSFTTKGEDLMREKFGIEFLIEDIASKIAQLAADESLTGEDKLKKEEELTKQYVEQEQRIDSIKQLLKAYVLFHKDVDYVVKDNKILIVDEFTGRLMPGRRYSDGIHEALEAKEHVEVQQETQTHATVTLQNYFKMYEKLSGMTGTAETEAAEFEKIYSLEVLVIPTNRPLRRENHPDVIYKTEKEKFKAICDFIGKLYERKQPVLVGTISIEKSEVLSRLLHQRGVPHNVLNAKYHEMEAHIVSQAGALGAVTIATNMAGRGTAILLGGNAESLAQDAVNRLAIENREERDKVFMKYVEEYRAKQKADHEKVVELGGLFVIGTERHESRRIDNQLRGRSGRQGDPGSSRFFMALE